MDYHFDNLPEGNKKRDGKMIFIDVYMDEEENRLMLAGKEVIGNLNPVEGYMHIVVGNYRISKLIHPYVLVIPAI